MGLVYVISDLHFGHNNMAIHRGFKDADEQDDLIIKNWNNTIKKRDTVWILGDITMCKATEYYKLDILNGIKKVVLGNHDKPSHSRKLLDYVNSVAGMVEYNNFIMTHCPIHPHELFFRFKGNIHGHVHENSIDDPRYFNVSAENINYTPILISSLT